jgi:hypothetical protein
MPHEVNRRVATCFVRDWSEQPLSVRSDARYQTAGVLGAIAYGSVTLIQDLGYVLMLGSQGETVLRQLESDVQLVAREQRLADHQKAALVTCVTSQLLSYAMNVVSKYLGPAAATEHYEGVCTEYAGISKRLMQSLDLEADLQAGKLVDESGSGGHAWTWVKIAGKKLWMDPQANPLRLTGPVLIDPEATAPRTPQYLRCMDPGASCGVGTDCCSGSCVAVNGAMKCAATACERSGKSFCAPNAGACTHIGGTSTSTSCGESVDGSACCAYER